MKHPRSLSTLLVLLFTNAFTFGQADLPRKATTPTAPADDIVPPRDYQTQHFLIHTDLPEDEAKALLKRLEATLEIISKYWGRKPHGTIECYVVKHLRNWRDSTFPHSFAPTLIRGIGGATIGTFERTDKGTRRKAIVYANARQGVAEHEAVHAYCSQNFLDLGPDWYKEGMAQMAYYESRGRGNGGVGCEKAVVEYLRSEPPKALKEIVKGDRLTGALEEALPIDDADSKVEQARGRYQRVNAWIAKNAESVEAAKASYHAGWALCHLMSQNPSYSQRFHALGMGYLNRQPCRFRELFGSVSNELGFEYRFFLERIEVGYRVDLCRWDWSTKFRSFEPAQRELSAYVHADRGFQASGMLVSAGTRYHFVTEGKWKTSSDRPSIGADGEEGGRGRLMGVVLADYSLGKPIRLGVRGTFKAERDGKLYLRCRDAWNSLADNKGRVTVRIRPMVDPSAAN